MSPRRYFQAFSNMPLPDYGKDLGPTLWFAFTAITGISKLFTYTPDFLQEPEQQPQAAISEGTEDTLDNKSL
jgi:hypothetical protein